MKILKLPWLSHREEHRKYEVYTADVSPDGERLATGGLDGKIRIWSVRDIVQMATSGKEPCESLRKPLASMSRHTGSVTVVRFSPDGNFLASGSDDRILLIWERDEEQKQPIFGSENDREHWNVRRRLVAHDNDIQDICWAPDSSILVTVGLDRSVIVWNGSTFEKIKRFDVHQSLVKGVIFDPANKYFATASDDRTVRIFRYHKAGDMNFSIEHVVSEPFKGSPITTYFRRLSWSPDGQHIAAPNATNGPVSSVSIISRGSWDTSVTLIGHDSPTEVVRFNPRLFQAVAKKSKTEEEGGADQDQDQGSGKMDPDKTDVAVDKGDRENSEPQESLEEKVDSVIATAGQDKTLVVWSTGRARPIFVAYDITNKSITDMVWNPEGNILFLTSLDCSIIAVIFEKNELGEAVPIEKNVEQLHRYGVDKNSFEFPESVKQLELEDEAQKLQVKVSGSVVVPSPAFQNPEVLPKPGTFPLPGTAQKPNVLATKRKELLSKKDETNIQTAKRPDRTPVKGQNGHLNETVLKNGRKRVAPTLISSGYSPTKPADDKIIPIKASSPSLKNMDSEDIFQNLKHKLARQSFPVPRLGIHSLIMGVRERGVDKYYRDEDSSQRNRDEQATDSETTPQADHIMRLNAKTTPDRVWAEEANTRYVENPSLLSDADVILVEFGTLGDLHVMEIRNGVERALQFNREALHEHPTKILGYHKGRRQIDIYIPEVVICAVGLPKCKCWALATADGTIYVYTSFGQHKLPKIALGHKVIKMAAIETYLVVLTESGLVYCWDIERELCVHKEIPVLPILCNNTIESNRIRVHKKIVNINFEVQSQDLLVSFINPQETFRWNSNLGCWVLSVT
ncbi:LAQU0S07e03356g1_1 [Lachancea quebecensis]|uniref:Protein HIR n=1 Tax=Lachancea quebecensis TaxID=1654605 RepID=A0A0P1KSY0_9SACH|nr:LAQU0S07e03356g1_1 [Lachancea quebecensis]